MPIQIRKLSNDEVARTFPRRGQMDLSEYVAALRDLQAGDSAEMELGGLSVRAAKRRLGQAATQLGHRLKWARTTSDERLYFQVLPGASSGDGRRRRSTAAATSEASATAAAPRRRGRPRRQP